MKMKKLTDCKKIMKLSKILVRFSQIKWDIFA